MVVGPEDDPPPPPSRAPAARTRAAKYVERHYPGEPAELRRAADAALTHSRDGPRDGRALGLVVPHGPWRYVASIAGAAIGRYALEETVVILAPNHAGRGPRSAIVCDGTYATPLGNITIEQTVAESIRALGGVAEAPEVFVDEHAIEDILPLLLARQPRLSIVPILIHDVSPASAARIGAAIADATVGRGGGVTLIATTDLAHYVPRDALDAESDRIAERARKLDDEALVDAFRERLQQTTGPILETCGLGALLTFVHAMRALGAGVGELCARGSSLQIDRDARAGVAWASLAWPRGTQN